MGWYPPSVPGKLHLLLSQKAGTARSATSPVACEPFLLLFALSLPEQNSLNLRTRRANSASSHGGEQGADRSLKWQRGYDAHFSRPVPAASLMTLAHGPTWMQTVL